MIPRREFLASLSGMFVTGFSLIAFEIAFSRILSVLVSYHYVFIVISMALLGLGLGGIVFHLFRRFLIPARDTAHVPALLACLYAVSVSFSVLGVIAASHVNADRWNVVAYCFLLLVPFFAAGALLAEVYRLYPAVSGKMYCADLAGGAAGAVAAVGLLDAFDAVGACFLLGVLGSGASLLFLLGRGLSRARVRVACFLGLLVLTSLFCIHRAGWYVPAIPIGNNPSKEIHDALTSFGGTIVETRWSAFGRTDLITFDEYPDLMDIYIDGTAGSPMYRFTGRAEQPGSAVEHLKRTFPGYFPFFSLREHEKRTALIIGSGGGRDVVLALAGGVRAITAVEINRDLVDIVRSRSRFNGGIYSGRNDVDVVVAEGRHFLKTRAGKYDLIMLSLPVTNTSRSIEGYSLTENFLFTTESIRDYLDHLTDQGRVVIVGHNDIEALRLISISLQVLLDMGIEQTEAMKRMYVVASDMYLVFVLKKTAFDPEEILVRFRAMRDLDLDPQSSYFPYVKVSGILNPALTSLGNGTITLPHLQRMVRDRGYNMTPVTDDSPFFYRFDPGTPALVVFVLWSSCAVLLIVVLPPLLVSWKSPLKTNARPRSGQHPVRRLTRPAVLFAMVGIGFMLIEISAIQRSAVFLGHPVLSLAVVLVSLLMGAGTGSLCSGRIGSENARAGIAWASLLAAVTVVAYNPLLDLVFRTLGGYALVWRTAVLAALLLPLGFFLGFPFPLGVRMLKAADMAAYIPWAWGVNCVGSVLGSALTVALAIRFGFSEVFLTAALCYGVVFGVFRKRRSAGGELP